jgi:hypothetical protein
MVTVTAVAPAEDPPAAPADGSPAAPADHPPVPPAEDPPVTPADGAPVSGVFHRTSEYHCECGHVLRMFGVGRHRVYFEPGTARLDDPVMNRACPGCGRGLPGKNRP